jgi:PPE-repeat protein
VFIAPEVIATQLTAGAGAAPMLRAAEEFGYLSVAYQEVIDGVGACLQQLFSHWTGVGVPRISDKANRFLVDLQDHSAVLLDAAGRTQRQADAFTIAKNAIIPLPEITENRTELAVAELTNVFGQNSAEIARLQTAYIAYTAQNNAVMSAYEAATAANMGFQPLVPAAPIAAAGAPGIIPAAQTGPSVVIPPAATINPSEVLTPAARTDPAAPITPGE